jgi:hypothetical protein
MSDRDLAPDVECLKGHIEMLELDRTPRCLDRGERG